MSNQIQELTTEQIKECIQLNRDIDVSNLDLCKGIIFHNDTPTLVIVFLIILVSVFTAISVFVKFMDKLGV